MDRLTKMEGLLITKKEILRLNVANIVIIVQLAQAIAEQ